MSLLAGGPVAAPAEGTDRYRAEYERRAAARSEPAWLGSARRAALERFQAAGFPNTWQEDWRFTNVAPIARTPFCSPPERGVRRVSREDVAALMFGQGEGEGPRIVFVDGRHAPELSSSRDTEGLEVRSLREVIAHEPQRLQALLGRDTPAGGPFPALNTALFDDGAFVHARPGTVVAVPVQVVFLSTGGEGEPTASYPRTVVVAGRASQLTLVESYGGPEGARYLTNAVTDVVAEDGAVVDHYKVQRESTSAYHVGSMTVRQGRRASFSSHSIALGAALARSDVDQAFTGEGGECVLNGLFMGSGGQHLDTHTRIDHAVPHCTSRELYKGVLDGRARGVFVGRVLVRPGAGKTDALQANKNLLLSREALVDSLPQLEILTDDVKCKHGSTTGQLDPAALFYLRSRGLPEAAARSLLVYAFASELVGRLKVTGLRAGLERYLQSHLPSPLDGDAKEAVL
ncbi:MAG TPA: Fe-S cluster assembly protein SufD [Vicinamibacteria bacterium]|nr:Fe-S cluster assembly protein SufD [Vicinamibacteria bacterium]